MLYVPFAYFGPDTVMPVASIVGAFAGVVMIFGRVIVRVARRTVGSSSVHRHPSP
jgi:hypothetical protein